MADVGHELKSLPALKVPSVSAVTPRGVATIELVRKAVLEGATTWAEVARMAGVSAPRVSQIVAALAVRGEVLVLADRPAPRSARVTVRMHERGRAALEAEAARSGRCVSEEARLLLGEALRARRVSRQGP